MKLEACVIVRNESVMITECLRSLKGIDLITIVDTGSYDNTVELCKQFTKRVYLYIWNDDFSAARNYALSKCTGDWILIIDADERLKTSIPDIKKIIAQSKQNVLCCNVRTQNEEILSTRIFKRQKEV
jgi:glycosyltransferase involved in cell wall biosynthesis